MRFLIFLLIALGVCPIISRSDEGVNDELYLAVFRGTWDGTHDNMNIAENCIKQGADVNAYYHTEKKGTALASIGEEITPLIAAVKHGDIAMIKFLLEHGADPNLPWKYEDNDPIAPISLAANFMNLSGTQVADIVKVLLDHGAHVNAIDPKSHWTPLMHIALRNRPEAVEVLLHAGADINAKDAEGETALMKVTSDGLVNIVELLLKHGANTSLTNKLDETALDMAIYQKQKEIAGMLMADKKSIGSKTINAAMYQKDTPLLKKLIEAGADVNQQDENGQTLLMEAADQGDLDMVKMLLEHQAKVDIKSKFGGTPFTRAVAQKHTEIAEALIEAGADMVDHYTGNWGALFTAAQNGQVEIINLMLDKGTGVDVRGSDDMTPLMAACEKGQMEAVRILLDHKANIEAVNSGRVMTDVGDNFVGTPLQWAEHGGHQDIADYLISKGAKPHPKFQIKSNTGFVE